MITLDNNGSKGHAKNNGMTPFGFPVKADNNLLEARKRKGVGMTTIGEKVVVHTSALIVPKGEAAQINFRVGQWEIHLQIVFVVDETNKEKGGISIETVDGNPKISLINWLNSLVLQRNIVITRAVHKISID